MRLIIDLRLEPIITRFTIGVASVNTGPDFMTTRPDPFAGSTVAPYGGPDTSYFEEVNTDFLVRDHSTLRKQLSKFLEHI